MSRSERFAALDVGTNTVLLLVAELSSGALVPVVERARITRLGKGVDRTGVISDDAEARTLACLDEYAAELRKHGVTRAAGVCTSAARDAKNGPAFLERARERLGFPLDIIDGRREAELTFAGSVSGLDLEGPLAVFDIGGGSTEIISGTAQIGGAPTVEHSVSLDIGSVRLTERFVSSDPVTSAEVVAIRDAIRGELARVAPPPREVTLVGVAGTMTTLAAIDQRLVTYDSARVHGARLGRTRIDELVSELSRMSLDARHKVPGLDPGRADVIVAGALLASEVLSWASANDVLVSDRGVRWGLVLELLRH